MATRKFGAELRRLRGDLTLREIQARSANGISYSYLSQLESGQYDVETISVKALASLALGYGMPLQRLLAIVAKALREEDTAQRRLGPRRPPRQITSSLGLGTRLKS